MKKYTKKQHLFLQAISADEKRRYYNDKQELAEDRGQAEKAEHYYHLAVENSSMLKAFLTAITIVYGVSGCELLAEIQAFAKEENRTFDVN